MRGLGIDVGGPRKGFDVALVDERRVLGLWSRLTIPEVAGLVARERPAVVGIDSPGTCAPDGETSRADERALARAVCGIRWTPDAATVARGGYYGWVVHGLELWAALRPLGAELVEVFPTASWTRWHGPRGAVPRSAWSRAALTSLGLEGVSARTSQDARDAIGAAVTASEHAAGRTERFGEIVVPTLGAPSSAPASRAPRTPSRSRDAARAGSRCP